MALLEANKRSFAIDPEGTLFVWMNTKRKTKYEAETKTWHDVLDKATGQPVWTVQLSAVGPDENGEMESFTMEVKHISDRPFTLESPLKPVRPVGLRVHGWQSKTGGGVYFSATEFEEA